MPASGGVEIHKIHCDCTTASDRERRRKRKNGVVELPEIIKKDSTN